MAKKRSKAKRVGKVVKNPVHNTSREVPEGQVGTAAQQLISWDKANHIVCHRTSPTHFIVTVIG